MTPKSPKDSAQGLVEKTHLCSRCFLIAGARCLLCGHSEGHPFCLECLPKVSGLNVCLLCKVKFKNENDRFCASCRKELGQGSDADGARFIRGAMTGAKFCRNQEHLLGIIPCFCIECDQFEPNWKVCEACDTMQGDFHVCKCGTVRARHLIDHVQEPRFKVPYLESRAVLRNDGEPIDADVDEELWLELRQTSMGASDAMKLLKMNGDKRTGFDRLLDHKRNGAPDQEFWAYAHGVQREPQIARWVQINLPNFRLCYNRFVFAGDDFRHLATPDMVGPSTLAEIKTSTKPIGQARTRYYDQLQWQMHVTGYTGVLFVVENRYSSEIEHELVTRDQNRIDLLVDAANELLDKL